MKVPKVTAFQIVVLSLLLDQQRSGREIRSSLSSSQSGPAFYQAMARLEDSGFVEGRYEQKHVEGNVVRERWYAITANGKEVYKEFQEFADGLKTLSTMPPGLGSITW